MRGEAEARVATREGLEEAQGAGEAAGVVREARAVRGRMGAAAARGAVLEVGQVERCLLVPARRAQLLEGVVEAARRAPAHTPALVAPGGTGKSESRGIERFRRPQAEERRSPRVGGRHECPRYENFVSAPNSALMSRARAVQLSRSAISRRRARCCGSSSSKARPICRAKSKGLAPT
jgi:hypothetical protein